MSPTRQRVLVPAISTFLMLIVLVGLGTWQIYRLHWKERILARIASAESAPAVPLPKNPNSFMKVSVTGRFVYDRAASYGAEVRDTASGPTMGSFQIVPLQQENGPPVLIDRGWVPEQRTKPLDNPTGVVTVSGYVHQASHPHWFSAVDDPAARRFFTLDPSAIGKSVGMPNVLPFILIAMGPAQPGGYPAPAQHLPRPPNNHLSYVITWYGLAVALLVIFGVWVRKGQQA